MVEFKTEINLPCGMFEKSKVLIDLAKPRLFSVYTHIPSFLNKGLEFIKLSSITNHPEIKSYLPEQLKIKCHNPFVTYNLGNIIRNKTVKSIIIDENVSSDTNTGDSQCSNSSFLDPYHIHIVTGDLLIVENSKLRKLLGKGPNYREPPTINFDKCLQAITSALWFTLALISFGLFKIIFPLQKS